MDENNTVLSGKALQCLPLWELNSWLRLRGSDTAVAHPIIGQTTKVLGAPRKSFSAGSVVKNPPVMQETQVRSLVWEDPLEEGVATHSSMLAWWIPWTEESGSSTVYRVAKSQKWLKWFSPQKELPDPLMWIRVSDMVVREDFLEEEEVTSKPHSEASLAVRG